MVYWTNNVRRSSDVRRLVRPGSMTRFLQSIHFQAIMNSATQRSIVRWIHLVFSIPILGYIYSPFEEIPNYAPATRFFFLPVLVLTGFWMWKGHVVQRLISKESA
jgi:hypothetical protein